MTQKTINRRTYRELINQIKSLSYTSGYAPDDSRFSDKLIFHTLLDMRSSYLERSKVQRLGIGQQNLQTISCIELELIDEESCPCTPPKGCKWQRSKRPIPKYISLIGVTNGSQEFKADFVELNNLRHKLNSRSKKAKESRYFTIADHGEGPYLYLYNDNFLEDVSAVGIWENPHDAIVFGDCDNARNKEFCNPLDTPVYLDGAASDVIVKMAFKYLSETTAASNSDITNDDQDNSKGVSPKSI